MAHPYAEFTRAGYQVDFASLTGDTPYLDALNLAADPDNLAFLTGDGWAAMQKARKLSDVDVKGYDAMFVPGGLAPMVDMAEAPLLKKVIAETYERGAVVGAVCHGPGVVVECEAERRIVPSEGEERHFVHDGRGRWVRSAGRAVRSSERVDGAGSDSSPREAVVR